jgi:uncharacterized membrane protein YoaK (UPF0700 family)
MGALNTLYLADGRARVAITYATGTLVSVGIGLAELLTGGGRTAWRRPLLLWSSLAAGAIAGAFVHRLGASAALGIAALLLLVLSLPIPRAGRLRLRRTRTGGPTEPLDPRG